MFHFCLCTFSVSDSFNKLPNDKASVIISLLSLTKEWMSCLPLLYEVFLVMKYHKEITLWRNYVLTFLKVILNFKDIFILHIKWRIGRQGKTLFITPTVRSRERMMLACLLLRLSFLFSLYKSWQNLCHSASSSQAGSSILNNNRYNLPETHHRPAGSRNWNFLPRRF